jgi:hypothetical protein
MKAAHNKTQFPILITLLPLAFRVILAENEENKVKGICFLWAFRPKREGPYLTFEFGELLRQVPVQGEGLAKADERSHNSNVDLDGAIAFEHAGEHGHALLGERKRAIFRC